LPTGQLRLAAFMLATVFSSLAAIAQGPPPAGAQGPPPAGQHFPPIPKPTNLKILPKDIAISDLIAIMKGYNGQLGVQCGYCHAGDAATHRMDFASDAKPEKATARIMMTMTSELNSKYIGQLPTGSDQRVACGTCHRGHAMPEEFVPASAPEPPPHP
jgi:hypothetical protein